MTYDAGIVAALFGDQVVRCLVFLPRAVAVAQQQAVAEGRRPETEPCVDKEQTGSAASGGGLPDRQVTTNERKKSLLCKKKHPCGVVSVHQLAFKCCDFLLHLLTPLTL